MDHFIDQISRYHYVTDHYINKHDGIGITLEFHGENWMLAPAMLSLWGNFESLYFMIKSKNSYLFHVLQLNTFSCNQLNNFE